jgi:hypothetical protein
MSNLMSYRSRVTVNRYRPHVVCGAVRGAALHSSQFPYTKKRHHQELAVVLIVKNVLGIAVYINRCLPPYNLRSLVKSSSFSEVSLRLFLPRPFVQPRL